MLVIYCIVELLKVNIRSRAMFAIYIIFEVIINNHAISLSCYDFSNLKKSKSHVCNIHSYVISLSCYDLSIFWQLKHRLPIFLSMLTKKFFWTKWVLIAILHFSIYHVFDIKNVKIVVLCNVWVWAKQWIPAKVLTNRKVWTSSLANRKPAGLVPWPMRGVSWSLSQECFLAA